MCLDLTILEGDRSNREIVASSALGGFGVSEQASGLGLFACRLLCELWLARSRQKGRDWRQIDEVEQWDEMQRLLKKEPPGLRVACMT
jgi:hypothetical protein